MHPRSMATKPGRLPPGAYGHTRAVVNCPQLFYPTGWEPSAYLLYKDVNRDIQF